MADDWNVVLETIGRQQILLSLVGSLIGLFALVIVALIGLRSAFRRIELLEMRGGPPDKKPATPAPQPGAAQRYMRTIVAAQ